MWFVLAVLLLVLVSVAVPVLYVAVTWDHDVVMRYAALPAPADLGTKEFRWRCWLSSLTRRGWRDAILHSACPRITLQCPFALLSADFAKMATSLGFPQLALEQLPFVFPQVAASGLFLQLLGNSNFPASVRQLRLKALTIVQLRPLDMRYEPNDSDARPPPELNCLMVLTDKKFLETEVEFTVQTDLFDDQGALWQSVTWFSVPFKQETLLAPLSASVAPLDPNLVARASVGRLSDSFACSKRNLAEFKEVSVVGLTGAAQDGGDAAPLMWMLARATAALQQQARVPTLPLMCNCVFGEDVGSVPLQKKVTVESWTSDAQQNQPQPQDAPKTKDVVKFEVNCDAENVLTGVMRTVGWTYEQEQTSA